MKLPLAAIWKKYKLVLLVAAVGVPNTSSPPEPMALAVMSVVTVCSTV